MFVPKLVAKLAPRVVTMMLALSCGLAMLKNVGKNL